MNLGQLGKIVRQSTREKAVLRKVWIMTAAVALCRLSIFQVGVKQDILGSLSPQ